MATVDDGGSGIHVDHVWGENALLNSHDPFRKLSPERLSPFRTVIFMRIAYIYLNVTILLLLLAISVNEWIEWKQKNRYDINKYVPDFIYIVLFCLSRGAQYNTIQYKSVMFMKIAFVFRFSCPSYISYP